MTITQLKKELELIHKDHKKILKEYEKRGIENLDYEETEHYGACLGWFEMSEYLLTKLKNSK
jgi:hypothetical protein